MVACSQDRAGKASQEPLSLSIRLHHRTGKGGLSCISTKSRVDHLIAQMRELECTREVLPSVIDDLGMIDV